MHFTLMWQLKEWRKDYRGVLPLSYITADYNAYDIRIIPKFYHLFFCIFSSLEKGGVAPKFVIIDDGWQSVSMDPAGKACITDNAAK
jgi:hypothetical protein